MVRQLVQMLRFSPLPASLLLTALTLLAILWIPKPALGFNVGVIVTGGNEFLPGQQVPFRVTLTFATNELVPAEIDIRVSGSQAFNFLDIPIDETGPIGPENHNGAVLQGDVTTRSGVTGYGYGGPDGATIVIIGTIQLPQNALPGTYTLRATGTNASNQTGEGSTSFTVIMPGSPEDPFEPPTPTPTPGPKTPEDGIPINPSVNFSPGVGGPNLNSLFSEALGGNVTVLTGNARLVLNDVAQLSMDLPGLGIESGMTVQGALQFTAGGLTLDTVDGRGTAVVDLGNGMTVSGNVTLVPKANRVEIVFDDPVLTFDPEAPDMNLLTGGAPDVTTMDAAFAVGLNGLPEGASLGVEYVKDVTALAPNADALFALAAEDFGGELGSLTDVAFAVAVTKYGITNDDLGDNTVTLTVSTEWYQSRLEAGKTIVITKIDDDGNVYTEEAECTVNGGVAICTATFTGPAGGFSAFALLALGQTVEGTPTPTPTTPPVTPPTPTPTPQPGPDGDGGNLLVVILVVLAIVVVAGGAGFYFLRRRPV